MPNIDQINISGELTGEDRFLIYDRDSGAARTVTADTALSYYLEDIVNSGQIKTVTNIEYEKQYVILTFSDGSTKQAGPIVGGSGNGQILINGNQSTSIIAGSGIAAGYDQATKQTTLSTISTASIGNHFVGIYQDLPSLQDAVKHPDNNYQAIVISPSEKYFHSVGGQWMELAPVGAIHPTYIGAYDTVQDLQAASPSAADQSVAIIGTQARAFYIKLQGIWNAITGSDLPSLTARVQVVESGLSSTTAIAHGNAAAIQQLSQSTQSSLQVMRSDIAQKISGIHVEDTNNNAFDDITSLNIDGGEVSFDSGNQVTIRIRPKFSVANGQTPESTSVNGSALIFPSSTITKSSTDPDVIIVGRTDSPSFDISMFSTAVDHGYAADDQGIKQDKTTNGWWIFKDIKQSSGRPADAVGDLIVFKNTIDVSNPALKHVVVMAIGKSKNLTSQVWFMYRDGLQWTPWFNITEADQTKIDNLAASVDEMKRGDKAVLDEVAKIQTAIGTAFTPSNDAFTKAVNSMITAALKNYKPDTSGHPSGGDDLEYPRIYVQFSSNVPTDLTPAVTSTTGSATILSVPSVPARLFVSVENDNNEASKVKGITVNQGLKAVWTYRDTVISGKKYRAFYSAGTFAESRLDVKVDFGGGN
ncbi:MAG: hypothetical protein ACRDCY_16475 [Aeromonas veronii]